MSEDYGFVIGLGAQSVAEDIDVGGLTERKFEFGDVSPDGFCYLGESDAEEANDDGEDFISGGNRVEHRGLHCSSPRRRDEVDIVFGHQDGSEVGAHAFEHVGVFRPAVVDHLLGRDLQHLLG